jgi:hypothetical protein
MVRRRRLPPELATALDAFRGVYAFIDHARSSLTEASPTTRFAGRPLPDVLVEYEEDLRGALARMPSWRRPELEGWWRACGDAIARGLALAERLRTEAPAIGGFEQLIGVLGELLSALDPFDEALAAFRSSRALERAAPDEEQGT